MGTREQLSVIHLAVWNAANELLAMQMGKGEINRELMGLQVERIFKAIGKL